MHNWVPVGKGEPHVSLFEKLLKVLPIVLLLVQLEPVIVLIHLYLIRIVSGQDFGKDPAVGEVSLGVDYLVG